MTQHNEDITLRQMLDMATEAVQLTVGRTVDDFEIDRIWCLAIKHLVVCVGEAANRLSPEAKQKVPQVPWPQIIAFRNRIVHGYDAVDYNRIWQVLQSDMPQLIDELQSLGLPEFK